MTQPTPVYCECAELAVEASAIAREVGLDVRTELSGQPLDAAAHAAQAGGLSVALCMQTPTPVELLAALDTCSAPDRIVLSALSDGEQSARGVAGDLGFLCVRDVAPAMAALALLQAGAVRAYRAGARKLSPPDRLRLAGALGTAERGAGRLLSLGAEGVAWQLADDAPQVRLGPALAVSQALAALRARDWPSEAPVRPALPTDLSATRDVLFGPPRVLSDPASKAALLPFGLPMPQEELCASPSRAAAEAGRIGFPVRISLASPDLRVWDHPDLSVDGVDNAARVRDVYRQLTSIAAERAPEARVLGVTVTATTLARALLRVIARPLPGGRVLLRVGFADPHGAIARDLTCTVLPASPSRIARALARLSGQALLLGETNAERDRNLSLLTDLFARVGAFVEHFQDEVACVELHPVALLVGDGAEVREAAIQVTDAFVRELAR